MKRNPSWQVFIPLLAAIVIGLVLYLGLGGHPERIPSPLVNQPAPAFSLATLNDPDDFVTESIFNGHVTLFNVWASWCNACRLEHPGLLQLAKDKRFQLIGMDYKDDPDTARAWLKHAGNPYALVLMDTHGKVAIDWGVYGTPETYVIDKKGRIRHRQVGIITPALWQETLEPLVTQLAREPS